jgi:DNA-binding NtrC family response regulator
MATGRVLIVAPDAELRRSLEFALEAEGYCVTSSASIGETTGIDRFDCTVVDHRAFAGPANDLSLAFLRGAQPVVLLVGAALPWLAGHVFRTVQKPLLGEPLSLAIREAVAEGRLRNRLTLMP